MSNTIYRLKVTEVRKETEDSISIHFEQPNPKFQYKSGQFLTLVREINGHKVRRAYSLCSSPVSDTDLAVAVKRVENGLMSNELPDKLKPGDIVELLEPMGNFVLQPEPAKSRHIVLFGGGSGITPLMSIAKTVLHSEPKSLVSLLYGNRNIESVIFKNELEEMERHFAGRFKVIHIIDQPPLNWEGLTGFMNHELVKNSLKLLPQLSNEDTLYFICGPQPMMEMVRKGLEEIQIPEDKIFKESFFNNQDKPAEEKAIVVDSNAITTQTVKIILDGKEHEVVVNPDQTILEAALDQDIDMPYSCQSGLCTACRGKALNGAVHLDEREGLSDSELKQGYVLTCVGHPKTPGVVIEIG